MSGRTSRASLAALAALGPAGSRIGRPRPPYAHRYHVGQRFCASWPRHVAGHPVVAQPRSGSESLAQTPSALGSVVALRAVSSAARTAVVGLVVVVTPQAEKPHKPQDQQADV